MKTWFRKYLTIISTVLLLVFPKNYLQSCGPFLDPEDTRFSMFNQDLEGISPLSNFNYTSHFLSFVGDERILEMDQHRNCREWVAYTHGRVKEKDVYLALYKTTAQAFITAYKSDQWRNMEGNSFVYWLRRPVNAEALRYVAFARRVEMEQLDIDKADKWPMWQESIRRRPYVGVKSFATDMCKTRINRFLKERYAFQAVKLMYYDRSWAYDAKNKDAEDYSGSHTTNDTGLIKFYEKYLKGHRTVVADWALLYYGLSFRNGGERALNLLRAFDRTEEKKVFVYGHLSKKEASKAEPYITDAKTFAALYAYRGIKNPGRALRDIKRLYDTDPQSKYIPLLVGREVNKLEDWILSPTQLGFYPWFRLEQFDKSQEERPGDPYLAYDYYAEKNLQKDREYLREVRDYLASLLKDGTRYDNFLRLAVVHLYQTDGDYAGARRCLDSMQHFSDPRYEMQLDIEKTISTIYTSDLHSSDARERLELAFEGLERAGLKAKANLDYDMEDDELPAQNVLSQLYLMLCNKLLADGDIVTSGLVFQKTNLVVDGYYGHGPVDTQTSGPHCSYDRIAWLDKYGTPDDVDLLLRFKNKKRKTAFEKRFTPSAWAKDDFYRDLKGIMLVRQGKFEEALAVMNKIAGNFWDETYEYKDYLKRSSVTSVGTILPVANGEPRTYSLTSKTEILKDIVRLRSALQKAHTDAAKARLCFLLGNSLFNITYYGKDWMMFSYGKTTREILAGDEHYKWAYYSFYPNSERYGKTYYECAEAIKMYGSALRYAYGDKELGAQCLLMLSVCDKAGSDYRLENSQNKEHAFYYDWQNKYAYPYLSQLAKQYQKTTVFAKAVTGCPDVEKYAK